jgi:hypothetical protein
MDKLSFINGFTSEWTLANNYKFYACGYSSLNLGNGSHNYQILSKKGLNGRKKYVIVKFHSHVGWGRTMSEVGFDIIGWASTRTKALTIFGQAVAHLWGK